MPRPRPFEECAAGTIPKWGPGRRRRCCCSGKRVCLSLRTHRAPSPGPRSIPSSGSSSSPRGREVGPPCASLGLALLNDTVVNVVVIALLDCTAQWMRINLLAHHIVRPLSGRTDLLDLPHDLMTSCMTIVSCPCAEGTRHRTS